LAEFGRIDLDRNLAKFGRVNIEKILAKFGRVNIDKKNWSKYNRVGASRI